MRHTKLRSLGYARGGATAVEFALVVPMFLMLVFGGIEFGRLLWAKEAMQETAIAGARCVAIAQGSGQTSSPCASGGTNTYIQNVAKAWGLTLASITPTTSTSCGGTGGFSQVTLTSTFNSVAPKLVELSSGGLTLTATACYPNNP
jgi:Flp pilus assembly protein TadG